MKITLYTLPIAGAAALSIPALITARRVEIVEDDSGAEQGVIAKFPNDGFVQAFNFGANREPLTLGSLPNMNGRGLILGCPIQRVAVDGGGFKTLRPADIYVKLTSATALAAKVRVTEFD